MNQQSPGYHQTSYTLKKESPAQDLLTRVAEEDQVFSPRHRKRSETQHAIHLRVRKIPDPVRRKQAQCKRKNRQ